MHHLKHHSSSWFALDEIFKQKKKIHGKTLLTHYVMVCLLEIFWVFHNKSNTKDIPQAHPQTWWAISVMKRNSTRLSSLFERFSSTHYNSITMTKTVSLCTNTNPRFCIMCHVLSRHFWSLISGYCLQHQLWVWNRIYLMETASVFQFTWKFFALAEIREPRSGQKLVQPLWNNFYSVRSYIRAPYLCVCCPGSAIFHRDGTSFGR